MTTIHAPRSLDVPGTTGEPEASAGTSVLTAGLSLIAVLGVVAGAAALIGFAVRAALAFFAG